MKVYLSGSISEDPDYRTKFTAAAEYIDHLGQFTIVNPAAWCCMALWPWAECILFDLAIIRGVDALVSLPGSEKSPGAQIEVLYARRLGLPVLDLADFRSWAIEAQRSAS